MAELLTFLIVGMVLNFACFVICLGGAVAARSWTLFLMALANIASAIFIACAIGGWIGGLDVSR